MTQGPLLLSLSNKWLWPGTAQPRWAAQVLGTHSRADQRAQGRVATPWSSHSVPCSCLLHCRTPDSRNSGSRLPFLAILQDTQMAPRPNPYVDTAVTCPAHRPQDRPLSHSACLQLCLFFPQAGLTHNTDPGFEVWFMIENTGFSLLHNATGVGFG